MALKNERVVPPLIFMAGCLLMTGIMRWHIASLHRVQLTPELEDNIWGNCTRYRVVTPASQTGGEYYTVELLVRPNAPGFNSEQSGSLMSHWHEHQQETVEVKRGTLGYTEGKQLRTAQAGERVVISKHTKHTLFNADNATELLVEVTHAPAGPLGERFWLNLAALGQDYRSLDRVHPMQVLVLLEAADVQWDMFDKHDSLDWLSSLVLRRLMAPLGRALGFRAEYPEYRGGEKETTTATEAAELAAAAAASQQEL